MPDRSDCDVAWETLWATHTSLTYEATSAFLSDREDRAVSAFSHLGSLNERMTEKIGGMRQHQLLLALGGLTDRFVGMLQLIGRDVNALVQAKQAWRDQGNVVVAWLHDEAGARRVAPESAEYFALMMQLYQTNVLAMVAAVASREPEDMIRSLVDALNSSASIAQAFSLVDIPMSDSIRGMIDRIRR